MKECGRIITALVAFAVSMYLLLGCGSGDELDKPIRPGLHLTKFFAVEVIQTRPGFPAVDLPSMHKPPDLPADYFQEGNIMVVVSIGIDYWPPEKLEVDFDGSGPLPFEEIDISEYPYASTGSSYIGKAVYILWPDEHEPPSEVPWFDISAVLTDRNGATHYSTHY